MVITRSYAAKHNIKLYEGLQNRKKNKSQNYDENYIFKFIVYIIMFITATIIYRNFFENKSIYNFIITDLPEKTIINLYNKIPARPYNYFLDLIQNYNIDYF